MKCPRCQTDNASGSKFCRECATPLPDAAGVGSGVPPADRGEGDRRSVSFTKTLETTTDELIRGTVFAGRYEIIEELGAGGMGRVYRAYDRKLEEEIALKLIRPEVAAERRTVERFRNEIKTARKITHKNVCRTHDFGEEGKKLYITMEYVRGEDLKSLIHRTKTLSVGTAVSIARQVAEGLGEAHRLGVVHRDLKPGNIMIDKDGNAKIMDFGIARSLTGGGTTAEGAVIGTPDYMSPEQVEGKPADPRADIYALGVILFEMVTGRPPFEGDTALAIAHKHRYEPAPDPRTFNPQLPAALGRTVLRALDKERDKRYQTTEELIADLDAVEATLPATERAPALRPSAGRRPGTSKTLTVRITPRKLLLPAAALVALVAAAVIWRPWYSGRTFVPPPRIENSIAILSLDNQTGDASNDYMCRRVIPDAFIVNLENSGLFGLVPTRERMTDVLKQMGKKDAAFITLEAGYELARRLGLKALVSGSVNKTGETFNILLRIQDAESRDSIASFRSGEGPVGSILGTQIDELSRGICEAMGASLEAIPADKLNISGVTTASLEAYEDYLKGEDLMEKYQWEEAANYFEDATRIDPSFASAYRRLSWAYRNLGRGKARSEAISKAMAFSDRATVKERLYIEGLNKYYQGDLAAFIRILEEIIEKYPTDKSTHFTLGARLIEPGARKLRDLERGIRELETGLELDPDFPEAYNYLGSAHSELGNLDQAEESYRRYANLSPGNANVFDSLGNFYFRRRGDPKKAIRSFRKALNIRPDFYMSNFGLAYVLAFEEDYGAALDHIGRYLARNPPPREASWAHFLRAFLFLWAGQYEAAFQEDALSAKAGAEAGFGDNQFGTAYMRGNIFAQRGDFEAANEQFDRALHAKMNFPSPDGELLVQIHVLFVKTQSDLKKDRTESATAAMAEIGSILPKMQAGAEREKAHYLRDSLAVELAIHDGGYAQDKTLRAIEGHLANTGMPSLANVWAVVDLHFPPPLLRDIVPRALLQKGDLDGAVEAYAAMTVLDPESKNRRLVHPLNYYRLGMLYEQKGINKKAKSIYRKFLELWKNADPGIPEVEDARKRMAAL